MPGRSWDKTHNPAARPLGCNGKYGTSGAKWHRSHGQQVCAKCSASQNHYAREARRKALRPRVLKPCGTNAAAERHRAKGEDLCWDCRLAVAERVQGYRDRKKLMGVRQ